MVNRFIGKSWLSQGDLTIGRGVFLMKSNECCVEEETSGESIEERCDGKARLIPETGVFDTREVNSRH